MGDLGKLIVATGFEKLPQSPINRPFWSHWVEGMFKVTIILAITLLNGDRGHSSSSATTMDTWNRILNEQNIALIICKRVLFKSNGKESEHTECSYTHPGFDWLCLGQLPVLLMFLASKWIFFFFFYWNSLGSFLGKKHIFLSKPTFLSFCM